ncbi:DsbA family protein [Aureispira anguillae]|nr:DsbA family protein [Aureispira anguillae]
MKNYQLIYYYDALCGWCYGFSPVMSEIYGKYHQKMDFDVVSGGLFLGDRVGAIGQVAPYIKAGAYKQVEALTGVKFGKAFLEGPLESGTMVLNSLYPATALCVVKEHYPSKTMEFSSLLQKAIYRDGMEIEDWATYSNYAAQIGLDSADFYQKLLDPIYQQKAMQDFETWEAEGLSGFPAVVLVTKEKRILLSSGYVKYDELEKRLSNYLNQ